MPRQPVVLFAALTLPVLAAACTVEKPTKVNVTATDTTCVASTHEAKSGEIEFIAENKGSVFTEVYLYGPGDRIMNERENIDPGQTKDFKVKVGGGDYELACKPGMIGDGIRSKFTVTGTPDPRLSEPIDCATARGRPTLPVTLDLTDTGFVGTLTDICVVAGQKVSFFVQNKGSAPHALAVFGPDGSKVGETPAIPPGQSAELPLDLTTLGDYRATDPTSDGQNPAFASTFKVIA